MSATKLLLALDLESVLLPEIWSAVSKASYCTALARTTRDDSDYGALMQERICLCRRQGLTLERLQEIVRTLRPLPGAVEFLNWAKTRARIALISDTFFELAGSLIKQLPADYVYCHALEMDLDGYIRLEPSVRLPSKAERVSHLQALGFQIVAIGDSFNDVPMFEAANAAILFNPISSLRSTRPLLPVAFTYNELKIQLELLWKQRPHHNPHLEANPVSCC